MPEIQTKNLRTFLAREIQREFSSVDTNVLLFLSDAVNSGNINSIGEEMKTRRHMQTGIVLDANSVSLMIPRINWQEQTIYQPYSYTVDNANRNYYVVTSENNVYVCISAGGGRISLEEPSGTGTDFIYLSNGYIWKFLYKVPERLASLITETHIPLVEVPLYPGKPYPYLSNPTNPDKQLQYTVQFATTERTIDSISVETVGSEFPNVIRSEDQHYVSAADDTEIVLLDQRASAEDETYTGYTIRIISGTGAGQFSKIIQYDGLTRTAVLPPSGLIEQEDNWTVVPDQTSKYEIVPSVIIEGDGTGAYAYAKMNSNSNTVDSVVLAESGGGYSYANAYLTPILASPATQHTLLVNLGVPLNPLGRNAVWDLNPTRVSILGKLDGAGERYTSILGSQYTQYGIWFNPNYGPASPNSGTPLSSNLSRRTRMDIESNGQTFGVDSLVENDFIVGSESYQSARIVEFLRNSPTTGRLEVTGLEYPFKQGENLYFFRTKNSDGSPDAGYEFFGFSAKARNVLLEDSVKNLPFSSYRLYTTMVVSKQNGETFDNYNDLARESGVTGYFGGSGKILGWHGWDFLAGGSGTIGGITATLFVNNVFGSTSSSEYGFTSGETLEATNGSTETIFTVVKIEPPELDLFSGRILYINSIEPVFRSSEQTDYFKIDIDF